MIHTSFSQLQNEVVEWIQTLRRYGNVFGQLVLELKEITEKQRSPTDASRISHYDDQLQTHLTGLRDLEQTLKTHHRKLQFESGFQISTQSRQAHQHLFEEFLNLEANSKNLSKVVAEFIASEMKTL